MECPHPTEEWMRNVVEHIVPAHLKTRLEQERGIDFSYFVPGIGRFRTNLFQQRGHWCLAMRYVKTVVPKFDELGLLDQIRQIAESPRGIVLVAGTTGCGKSTTLAAMVEHINANFKKHIITLEDPIEYVFEDNQCVIEQREVGLDTVSFEHALKHVLRQDPDVIMIGEMRDSTQLHGGHERGGHRAPRALDRAHHQRLAVGQPYSRFLQSRRAGADSAAACRHIAGGHLPAHGQRRSTAA